MFSVLCSLGGVWGELEVCLGGNGGSYWGGLRVWGMWGIKVLGGCGG
jgi:hypothetical protein